MDRIFIFLESNTSGTGRLFASTASRLGFRPVMLVVDPKRYSYIEEDRLDYIQLDTGDYSGLEHCVNQLKSRFAVEGIYSSSEYFVGTAAKLANRCQLYGESEDAIHSCRNKYLQRTILKNANVSIPSFLPISSLQQLKKLLPILKPPVVLKPIMGSGSVGVRLCRTKKEVETHAELLFSHSLNERGRDNRDILVEEYIPGQEYSVEVMGSHVVGITAKHVSPEPYFVETGHDFPAQLTASLMRQISQLALASVRAVGLNWGPAHVEIRNGIDGPRIIEINPRLAGGFIPELVRLATGIDLIEATLRLAVGQPISLRELVQRYSSIRFVMAPAEGVLQIFTPPSLEVGVDEFAEIQMYRRRGDLLSINHDFRDRIGHVMVCANSRDAALQQVSDIHSRISISVQPQTESRHGCGGPFAAG